MSMPGFHPISKPIWRAVYQEKRATGDPKYKQEMFRLTLRQYDEENFPLAFTVLSDRNQQKNCKETPYRVLMDSDDPNNFKLFFPVVKEPSNASEKPRFLRLDEADDFLGEVVVDAAPVEEIGESINETQQHSAVFDGLLWEECQEPIYIFDKSQPAHPQLFIVNAPTLQPQVCIYRADELPLLTADIEKCELGEAWKALFYTVLETNHIRVESAFITRLPPRDERLFNELERSVFNYLRQMFTSDYQGPPVFEGFHKLVPALETFKNGIVSRLWNDRTIPHGTHINKKMFQTALIQELGSLYEKSEPS